MLKVLLLSQCLIAAVVVLCPGDVTGQFTAPSPTCPGDTIIFTCNVTGNSDGFTIWRVNGSSECTLRHGSTSPTCQPSSAFTARSGTGFVTNATSFSSTLNGTATSALNGTLVECFGPDNSVDSRNRVGDSTLQILGPPSVPTLYCVDLSGDGSGAVNVTVSWTLSGGDSADFYLINITTNAPQTPYGGLLNITTASVTQHELTGFMAGYEYNITVHGVNCGSQEGRESEPLTITPQVPAISMSEMCAVYAMVNGTLQSIENSWSKVNISEDCVNEQDITTTYVLTYTTDSGTPITTCVVDGTDCSNGTCRHQLQNNTVESGCQPTVSRFSGEGVTVSVTARNMVGRSDPAVSRRISGTNIDLEVRIDTTNLSSPLVECTFFQAGYTCTIDYGTDPSYTNLVYRDNSSTQGRQTTITLSQRLREDTTYYYIVSAESSSQCVRVRGRFRAGCNEADLTDQSGIVNPARCTDRFANGSSISGGVVCYNGTGTGSAAVYICDDGYVLMEGDDVTRVCQSDGNWNGSISQCIQRVSIVGVAVGVTAVLLMLIIGSTIVIFLVRRVTKKMPRIRADYSEEQTLHSAASQGDLQTVKILVDRGVDIHCENDDQWTALHFAARQGHGDIVTFLVERGAIINKTNENGDTPLLMAAEKGRMEVVKYLHKNEADIRIRNIWQRAPLHAAAEKGHIDIVRYLANEVPADINIKDKLGQTPLHLAAVQGHVDVVKHLVEEQGVFQQRVAAISLKDKDKRTPIHLAADNKHMIILDYLIQYIDGADIDITDVLEGNSLPMAAREGYVKLVKFLVCKGANINKRDELGETPLHNAAKQGYVDIVKFLVSKNADIKVQNEYLWTPLHVAADGDNVEIVRCLVDVEGADINIKGGKGWTPLHVAAERGNVEIVTFLVVVGRADINIEDDEGMTPMKIADQAGNIGILKLLCPKETHTQGGEPHVHVQQQGVQWVKHGHEK